MAEYHPPSLKRLHIAFSIACLLVLAAAIAAFIQDSCSAPCHVQQVALKNLPLQLASTNMERVDRCITCHQNMDGSAAAKSSDPALRPHPRFDLFVAPNSKHPYATFGCSICHHGQPTGVEFSRAAHSPRNPMKAEEWKRTYGWSPLESWEPKMLPLQHTDASCLKCHNGLNEIQQAAHANEGRRLFDDLGCANCHPSRTIWQIAPRVGSNLRRIGEKDFQPWVRRWIADPLEFRPSTRMPRLFGLENRKNVHGDPLAVTISGSSAPRDALEIEAIASYLFAASKLQENPPVAVPAGRTESGRRLFVTAGCAACHPTRERSGSDLFTLSSFAPDLSRIGSKVPAPWLYAWLKNPSAYAPDTRMPDLKLADTDAADLAAYLLQTMLSQGTALPSVEFPEEAFDALIIEKLGRTMPQERIAALLKDSDGMVAAATSRSGEWTEAQSAKIREVLLSSPNQTRATKAFFAGEFLIRHHNCFGCHAIQSFQRALHPCPNLQGEGSKNLAQFAFGRTLADGLVSRTRWDWLRLKISQPRIFDLGSLDTVKPFDRLRMPQFALDPSQIESLATHLLSMTTEPIPASMQYSPTQMQVALDRGKRIFRDLNCVACHTLDPNQPPQPTGALPAPDGTCRVKETWLRHRVPLAGPLRGIEDSSDAESKEASEKLRAVEHYLGRFQNEVPKR